MSSNNRLNEASAELVFRPEDEQSESPWVYAIAVVSFHVQHGQIIELLEPSNVIDETLQKKICCLALPDSNSGQNGDLQFAFRVREDNMPLDSVSYAEHSFLFASVFFRQIRDENLPRGYFQKSVVLLSRHPYTNFLHECARIIGPLFFEFGKDVLEAVWTNIETWDPPVPGASCHLPLAGETVYYRVPWEDQEEYWLENESDQVNTENKSDKARIRNDTAGSIDIEVGQQAMNSLLEHNQMEKVPGLFQDIRLFTTFGGLSVALWHVWELAMIGEPILVLAPAPDSCSQVVMAIASMIAPIQYQVDYRPYFTIYDPDFNAIRKRHDACKGQNMPSPCVLGVTNPYFLKAFEYWPNVIAMGSSTTTPARPAPLKSRQLSAGIARDKARGGTVQRQVVGKGMGHPHPQGMLPLSLSVGRSTESMTDASAVSVSLHPDDTNNTTESDCSQEPDQEGLSAPSPAKVRVIRRHEYVAPSDLHLTHSVQGDTINNATYHPTIARRDESLNSLLVHQRYERSMILTRDEPLVPPDENVLSKLVVYHENNQDCKDAISAKEAGLPWEAPAVSMNNNILRKHFRKLTKQFLAPLETYYRLTSVGSRAAQLKEGIQLSAYSEPSLLHEAFNEDHFMPHLEMNLPPLMQRLNWKELYKRFIHGPNFVPWCQLQQSRLQSQLGVIYRHLRLHTDTKVLLMGKSGSRAHPTDNSCVHLYLNVKKALEMELAKPPKFQDRELCRKMNEHLASVKALLHNAEGVLRRVEGQS